MRVLKAEEVTVQTGAGETGLIVDAIRETVKIEPKSISAPLSVNVNQDKSYISGVASLPDDCICILVDVLRMFEE